LKNKDFYDEHNKAIVVIAIIRIEIVIVI